MASVSQRMASSVINSLKELGTKIESHC